MSAEQSSKADPRGQPIRCYRKEELITLYPPQWEQSEDINGKPVFAQVSRNEEGHIVYVVPGSITRVLPEEPQTPAE